LPPVKFCFAAKPYQIRLKSDVLFYLTVIKELLEVSATISIFLRKNQSFMKRSERDMKIGAGRVIHRVLQGLRDFALRAAPLHLRALG
jgi:hypothetical protein